MRIPLTHYGRREMVLATAVCAVLAAAGAMLFWPAAVLPAAAWAFVILFFRDPQRRPEEAEAFVSPADGKVVDISPVGPEGPLGERGTRIGIFMSLLDVHVNRSPCQGLVARVDRREGGYADARSDGASETNASSTIVLAHERSGRTFPVVVRQIAGMVARRIVTDLRAGQTVSAGQRIGMVKFGSRVELIVPEELIGEVRVGLGQAVRAGRTALVRPPPGGRT